jgi:hypothetical protein
VFGLDPIKGMLRRAAEIENRYLGASTLVSPQQRRRIRQALGIAPRPSPRRFIPASLGVEDFFRELRRRNVKYAVLRWFETLPHVEPGEDIDLLVADDDLPFMAALLDHEQGLVPCDVYTATALYGTSYRGTSYLPPMRAKELLERARLRDGLVSAPCPEDHFLSLAYHAVYQKGLASGLSTSNAGVRPSSDPEHDYAAILAELAKRLGVGVEITMEDLDRLLEERGWRPQGEMLSRLAEHNPWLDPRHGKTSKTSAAP